jgi:hypothetical protein
VLCQLSYLGTGFSSVKKAFELNTCIPSAPAVNGPQRLACADTVSYVRQFLPARYRMILNPVKVKGAGSCLKKHIVAAAVHFTT